VDDSPASTAPATPSQRDSLKRSTTVAIVGIAFLVAAVWFLNSPAILEVAEAEVGPNDGITATVNSCQAELSIDVYEDDSLVVIRVFDHRFRVRFSGGDCQDAIQVPLSVPLGGRMLVDGSTDRALIVP
jgi:hypothetical protein